MSTVVKYSSWLVAMLLVAQVVAQDKSPTASKAAAVAPQAARPAGADTPVAKGKAGTDDTKSGNASAGKAEDSESKSEMNQNSQGISVIGRRDPFRPITLNLRTNVRRRENLSPLERFDLGQLKLVGIVWSIKSPTALVEDSTGLGYSVKVGTPIGSNDGKVKTISPDALLIEEDYIDLYGAKKKREVSMRLAVERSE